MREAVHEVEILLIEDSPEDAELTIRVLQAQNLANRLVWLKNATRLRRGKRNVNRFSIKSCQASIGPPRGFWTNTSAIDAGRCLSSTSFANARSSLPIDRNTLVEK